MTIEEYVAYVKDSIEELAKSLGIPKQFIKGKNDRIG